MVAYKYWESTIYREYDRYAYALTYPEKPAEASDILIMRQLLFFLLLLQISQITFSQRENGSVGIGTATPDKSALLDLTSTNKGMLIPRMTAERKNMVSPVNGMMIYDSTVAAIFVGNGMAWTQLGKTEDDFVIRATGNDNTDFIQAAVRSHRNIIFDTGLHVINSPIRLYSNTTISFRETAVLIAGSSKQGELNTKCRHFILENISHVILNNADIREPLTAFDATPRYGSAYIAINNSSQVSVLNARISYAGSKEAEAVWISGPLAKYNLVSGCRISGLGIVYCENGASYSTIEKTTITGSKGNALSGIGNGATYSPSNPPSKGCRISDCNIFNAGRMGLEEINTVNGSVITSLDINKTGTNPMYTNANQGFGISVVSREWVVNNCRITDARTYGIETFGNSGGVIQNNTIVWTNQLETDRTGIIGNFTSPNTDELQSTHGLTFSANKITNATIGIEVVGVNNPQVTIENNYLVDPVKYGIYSAMGENSGMLNITGNTVEIRSKSLAGGIYQRKLLYLYQSVPTAMIANISNNQFYYRPSASGGNKYECAVVVGWDNALVSGNSVIGNNITGTAGQKVEGFHAQGCTSRAIRFVYNRSTGANNNLGTYTNPYVMQNSF